MCTQLALYERALECHQKALNVKLILLGANSLDTAISYAWMGMTLQKQGNQTGAIEYYQKALIIRQAALDMTIVAVTYMHIARLS
jgi:tetratricopeptide (TPR) repeat protein